MLLHIIIHIIKSRRGNLFSNEQFIKNRTTIIYQISFVHIIMFFPTVLLSERQLVELL